MVGRIEMGKKIYALLFLILFQLIYIINVSAENYNTSGYLKNDIYPLSIKIKKNFNGIYDLGKEYQLTVDYNPSSTTEKDIIWTSSDSSILSIDENGKIVGKKNGTVKITAKTVNGKTDSITLTVYGSNSTSGELKAIKSIAILNNPKQMLTGDSFILKLQTNPINATSEQFTYKSSNNKVLTVDKNGKVKAVGKGKTTITVKTSNNKVATASITVKNYKVKISQSNIVGYEGNTKKIAATIETNKNIDLKNVKWSVTSTSNSTIKPVGNTGNTYKASLYLKNQVILK